MREKTLWNSSIFSTKEISEGFRCTACNYNLIGTLYFFSVKLIHSYTSSLLSARKLYVSYKLYFTIICIVIVICFRYGCTNRLKLYMNRLKCICHPTYIFHCQTDSPIESVNAWWAVWPGMNLYEPRPNNERITLNHWPGPKVGVS